ncbi:MAG: stage V sporulation protein D [Bacillota bacterium]|nr:stage V sporulation protein D [Bacillota bacterium]
MMFVFIGLFLFFVILAIRLFVVMVLNSPQLKNIAEKQWTSEVQISAKRGRILDSNGNELAISGNVYRVDLDMNTIRETLKTKKTMSMDSLGKAIAQALGMKQEDVNKKLNQKLPNGLPIQAVTIARRVEKAQADNIKNLKVNGIIVSPDTKRYYPNDNLLSQVIGHTNSDGKGLTGVEYEYDQYLAGIPGKRIAELDRNRSELPYSISTYTKPIDGKDVVLTEDEMIQKIAEKWATQALNDNKAKAVSIVVMNPKNGEILAMANKPDYNLNDPWQKDQNKSSAELQKSWRNRAVSDAFEPGSIFKVITATAAMEEGLVKEDDKFNCSGAFTVANRVIHCWKRTGHGEENFIDILKNSCNAGFAVLGQRLGAEKLNKYINLVGFGQKTGIDLPGEARGIIKPTNKVGPVDLATIAFGQANTVSMIQYMAAFNSVANGGIWIRPHVMKKIVHYDENGNEVVDKQYDDYGKKQIISENTAKTLRGYLEQVVSTGGGKNAFIAGYHIAGKTGTAQKPNPNGGGYAAGKYISSFAGMAPANDPQLTVLVSIDEPDPSNYYAGQIAAPVGKGVFNDVFNYLAFKPDASNLDVAKSMLKDVVVPNVRGLKKAEATKLLKSINLDCDIDQNGDYITDMSPKPGDTVKEGTKIVLYTGSSPNYNDKVVIVPSLVGYSKDKAQQLLDSIGLKLQFNGSGIVSEQDIEEGTQVERGTTINLTLDTVGD